MNAMPYAERPGTATRREPRIHRATSRRHHLYVLGALALAAAEVAGMAAVARAYQLAQATTSSTPEFAWFWAGMALMVLPLAGLAASRTMLPAMRTGLLILYGFVSYAPKLLRSPASPVYHDEFASWRQTEGILRTGGLFHGNQIVPIAADYPGLHALTATLVNMTGLSIWQAATVLLVCLHVLLLLGMATLAASVGMDSRTAALAAILYSLNSSFLYFDTQFAYESMAIVLVVWALAACAQAVRSRHGQGRAGWAVLAVTLAAGTVVTHHLSDIFLILTATLVAIALTVPRLARTQGWAGTAATAWAMSLAMALITALWFTFAAPSTISYLSPYLGSGLDQLLHDLAGTGSGRHLFAASLSPWWEQQSAYVTILMALGVAAAGLLVIRSRVRSGQLPRGPQRALLAAFALLGLVYFPSTLFILSPSGAEGARRSWAFTWIGLSLLAAPAVAMLIDWAGRRRSRPWHACSQVALTAALGVALVGGTAAGLNASYRFPGLFLYGSDTRSITPELYGASDWLLAHHGSGHNIVTDRYTALIFGSFGLQTPAISSAGFPIYDLYLAPRGALVPASLLAELSSSHFAYLVVDQRMAHQLPQLGEYFNSDDPTSLFPAHGTTPVFHNRLAKFATIPWLVKIFQSDNYSIYRFDLPPGQAPYRRQSPALRGRLSVTS